MVARIPRPSSIADMEAAVRKRHGVHYTPAVLARFLAGQTVLQFDSIQREPIRILDPACGEGELLAALIAALPCPSNQIEVTGIEQDSLAAATVRDRMSNLKLNRCEIRVGDFLEQCELSPSDPFFDIVIANPPYVRTQVLGGRQAQQLAKRFGLSGRVDLYQVFAIAISQLLKEGGALGLLTSNRFLTVKSGIKLRQRLTAEFDLREVFDLGDTRLFEAAVLPAVVTGVKKTCRSDRRSIGFHRVYRSNASNKADLSCSSILEAVADLHTSGMVETDDGRYLVERGELAVTGDDSIWTMSNQQTRSWLARVKSHQVASFGEMAEIKVGVKTTADRVFVRENWCSLPVGKQPEDSLLRPLITHHDARRWSIVTSPQKTVLYPYDCDSKQRKPIVMKDFPKAAAYLRSNRQQLEKRKYLVDSGRKWYEIWVPHRPQDWAQPKIVWPDISAQPKFFLDQTGAIVNGDCYWIKLRPDTELDWIYLMLGVANSSVATTFYDTVFHNKLYAGRRRFMTQYVKDFPLPDINTPIGVKIVRAVKQLIVKPTPVREQKLEMLVQQSFGF